MVFIWLFVCNLPFSFYCLLMVCVFIVFCLFFSWCCNVFSFSSWNCLLILSSQPAFSQKVGEGTAVFNRHVNLICKCIEVKSYNIMYSLKQFPLYFRSIWMILVLKIWHKIKDKRKCSKYLNIVSWEKWKIFLTNSKK